MPQWKTNGFTQWVGQQRERLQRWTSKQREQSHQPKEVPRDQPPSRDEKKGTLKERMEQRFEQLMQEVEALSTTKPTVEEHVEYSWIILVRLLLPLLFFVGFGYEDGLFMTGFQYFTWIPFIMIMYGVGYGLEGLRVAIVYSMAFSKAEERNRAWKQQFIFWIVLSLGCGVAQLASALVIQALGADQAINGGNAVARGASVIMARIPSLVYIAIGTRVALCAVADWACSGFLYKRRETVEQRVSKIMTRANNFSQVLQAQNTSQTIVNNAQHYEEVVADERSDLKALRKQQRKLSNMAFQAGMNAMKQNMPEMDEGLENEDEE